MASVEFADIPEPDRVEGAPHPRHSAFLYGQAAAEAEFLASWQAGRMHHGWLLAGPRGVGKATLAWRIARAMVAAAPGVAPGTLQMAADAPVFRRVASLGESRVKLIRRGWDDKLSRLRTRITVDDTRTLHDFLGLSAADGGWRVVIVDPVDEMNASAANAMLKLLEEPPKRTLMLLISHAPARLLPTIRSRCRRLDLRALPHDALIDAVATAAPDLPPPSPALAELSGGSAGDALRLSAAEGPEIYARLLALFNGAPGLDRAALNALADSAAGPGSEARRDALARMGALLPQRLARAAAMGAPGTEAGPGEARLMARLACRPAQARIWAEAADAFTARLSHALGVNLDPGQAFLDTFLALDAAAGRAAAA
ncbi:MAG: DNA polymerase-3 subunit delta' [Paracoccaceae bacterium]|jgi:DNA polymerase-3 subunit delta'